MTIFTLPTTDKKVGLTNDSREKKWFKNYEIIRNFSDKNILVELTTLHNDKE